MNETVREAARRLAREAFSQGFTPEALHEYTDVAGAPLFWRIRLRHPTTREKWIRPMRPDGRGGYELGEPSFEGGKPLYHLHELAKRSSEPVVLAEGERCIDAFAKLRVLATTSGGADSAERADWSPLAGRNVVIWPDNDEPGQRYATAVRAKLLELGCTVRLVDVAALKLPHKGDVVDWLEAHPIATADDVVALPIVAGEPSGETSDSGVRVVTLASVAPRPITWVWRDRLPLGKLVLLDGDPGLGKSTLTMALAARVTTGSAMPDGSPNGLVRPRGVVFLSAEDDPADTMRPRADRAGADVTRIGILEGVSSMSDSGERVLRPPTVADVEALREAIRGHDAALVVIDPLMAYLTGDAHRDQDVRQSLAPLQQLAADTGTTILVVRHLNKSGGGNAVYRGGGSIGIIGAARLGLLVARDPDDETGERRILAVSKSNLGPIPPSLAYHMEAVDDVPGIVWEGTTSHNASALLAVPHSEEERSALDEAREFLRDLLADGPIAATEATKQARSAGISDKTLQRARKSLGVVSLKTGRPGSRDQGWAWQLPEGGHTRAWPSSAPSFKSPHLLNIPKTANHESGRLRVIGPDQIEVVV